MTNLLNELFTEIVQSKTNSIVNSIRRSDKRSDRQKQLSTLLTWAALTMVTPYVIQGIAVLGNVDADLSLYRMPTWFWILDAVLWGIRALIEARVIFYAFSTQTQTKVQEWVMIVGETILIGMVMFTVGMVFRSLSIAAGSNELIEQLKTSGWHDAWAFGIAAYPALMIAVTGIAYKFQPHDLDMEVVNKGEVERLQKKIEDQSLLIADMSNGLEQSQIELGKIETRYKELVHSSKLFGKLSVTGKLQMFQLLAGMEGKSIIGTKPGTRAQDWATDLGVSVQTVYQALQEPEKVLLRLNNGNGNGEE